MEFEAVKIWYENHIKRQIRHRWLLAGLGFVLMPFATIVGTALIYGFLFLFAHQSDSIHQPDDQPPALDLKCFWITLGIVLVMFIVNFLIPKKKRPETFYSEEPDVDDSVVGQYVHRRKVVAKLILWIILTGPRLLSWAIFSLKEISRLKKQDTHSCAALLWLLTIKGCKVPYDNIPRDLDWLDVGTTLSQIQDLPGVVFLKNPPPGVSLTDDLRAAIRTGEPI
jgi:MFS family permease